MDLREFNDKEVLLYEEDIMKITELSFEEVQELVKTKEGIKQLIRLLTEKLEFNPDHSYFSFLGLLNLIEYLADDEIINTYIYQNDFIYNQIINNRNDYYDYIARIIPIIESDELKAAVFKKYKEIFVSEDSEYGKTTYDTKSLIRTVFSFHSQIYIKEIFTDETISTILNKERFDTQSEVIKEIANKNTDEEKRECIIPEVLLFLDADYRAKPIISIESDSIKKECMNDDRIKEILLKDERYHTYAKVIASYKESNNIEEALEEGINNNYFDGEDLAIMISSIKGDAKKTEYLNDKRIKGKFSIDDEAAIVKSYSEEDADQVKYDFINNRIINEAKQLKSIGLNQEYLKDRYHNAISNILVSVNDKIKNKCLNDDQIKELLHFSDICEIVKKYKDDIYKFTFIKENISKLAESSNHLLRELMLTMKTEYKKQCLEDDEILEVLRINKEKQQGGLTIIDVIASNYLYCISNYVNNKEDKDNRLSTEEIQQEQNKEDDFKDEFLKGKINNLDEREIFRVINSINNPELKLDWVIECASNNLKNLNYINNITNGIDKEEYKIVYDGENGMPVSYNHRQ